MTGRSKCHANRDLAAPAMHLVVHDREEAEQRERDAGEAEPRQQGRHQPFTRKRVGHELSESVHLSQGNSRVRCVYNASDVGAERQCISLRAHHQLQFPADPEEHVSRRLRERDQDLGFDRRSWTAVPGIGGDAHHLPHALAVIAIEHRDPELQVATDGRPSRSQPSRERFVDHHHRLARPTIGGGDLAPCAQGNAECAQVARAHQPHTNLPVDTGREILLCQCDVRIRRCRPQTESATPPLPR